MKFLTLIGASFLIVDLGATAPGYAQRDHGEGRGHDFHQEHGNRHQGHERHSETHARGPERREVREERHEEAREREHAHYQPVSRPQPHPDFDHGRPRDIWQRNRAAHWEREHHNWRERGGYRGYRIPDERFRAHFGRGHWFRVHSVPVVVVERYPRFQYAGFWFTLVDPWPETWSARWYETDDVYIDYIHDGYYMCNRSHPGVFIAVNVSL
jgi:hypothetical protein